MGHSDRRAHAARRLDRRRCGAARSSASAPRAPRRRRRPVIPLDLDEAVILPGLVNAHTHLELAHMAGQVPPASNFVAWVRAMLGVVRRAATVASVAAPQRAPSPRWRRPARWASATSATPRSRSVPLAALVVVGRALHGGARVPAADAGRVAGEHAAAPEWRRPRLCAAAARAPGRLRGAARAVLDIGAADLRPTARAGVRACPRARVVHCIWASRPRNSSSSPRAAGPFRDLLGDLGAGTRVAGARARPRARTSSSSGPCTRAARRPRHAVHAPGTRRPRGRAGATLVLCPRSNRWVGAGVPPVAAAVAAGVRLAIGTDSLASVADLNLFAELAYLRSLAPGVPASALLRAATLGGARALGCDSLGVLAPAPRAARSSACLLPASRTWKNGWWPTLPTRPTSAGWTSW